MILWIYPVKAAGANQARLNRRFVPSA